MHRTLTAYEHQLLRREDLLPESLESFQRFHGNGKNFPYYRLVHNGIRLTSYVGVLRVGRLTIEILPKPDRRGQGDTDFWRGRLLDMLRLVHDLPVYAPTSARQAERPAALLHLYLERLLVLGEQLLQRGLARGYREAVENTSVMRGRLLFAEQLRHNLVHRERVFVAHDRYDFATPHNRVLRVAISLAARLNRWPGLQARFDRLLARWPVVLPVEANEAFFRRLRYDRATATYRPAIEIARLLLLRYQPALRRGDRELLALLFDANRLWEAFLERVLRRGLPKYHVSGQAADVYWESQIGPARLRPDLIISSPAGQPLAVLDAKWKLPANGHPAATDLQQLFTYAHFHDAPKVALLYPSSQQGAGTQVQGQYRQRQAIPGRSAHRCDLLFLDVATDSAGQSWTEGIVGEILTWLEE